jgi:hypothetical protein
MKLRTIGLFGSKTDKKMFNLCLQNEYSDKNNTNNDSKFYNPLVIMLQRTYYQQKFSS